MDVCQRSLRRTNHATRGVLPTVVRRCVWSRNLVKVEALAHWGLSRQKQQNNLQLMKLYNNAVYPFKCWYSLKKAINNSRNVKECYRVQDRVYFVGDKLVYGFISFTKIEIYLVSKSACLCVVLPSVYNFLVLWYVDTSLHALAHASIARIQLEIEMAHSAG